MEVTSEGAYDKVNQCASRIVFLAASCFFEENLATNSFICRSHSSFFSGEMRINLASRSFSVSHL